MREERKKVKEPNAAGAAMTAAPVVDAAAPAVVADPVMEKEGGMVDVPETEEFDAPLETGTVVRDTLESGGLALECGLVKFMIIITEELTKSTWAPSLMSQKPWTE